MKFGDTIINTLKIVYKNIYLYYVCTYIIFAGSLMRALNVLHHLELLIIVRTIGVMSVDGCHCQILFFMVLIFLKYSYWHYTPTTELCCWLFV